MKAIKVDNAPKSMVMILVENDITFAYNWGDILLMGTSNIDKFKARMINIGMAPFEVESLSCKVVKLDDASEIYDF